MFVLKPLKKMRKMVNLNRRGRISEKKIVNYLKKKGFRNIRRSRGSRGPADIYAKRGNTKFYIQVKYGSAFTTRKEITRLRKLARERKEVAAVIHRSKKGKLGGSFSGDGNYESS